MASIVSRPSAKRADAVTGPRKDPVTIVVDVQGDDIIVRLPGILPLLEAGEMIASSTGKSTSPVAVVVPRDLALAVERADGTTVLFSGIERSLEQ